MRATCLLRAFAEDHSVVGELSFTPEYGADQPLEETVRTERRATSLELIGLHRPGAVPAPLSACAASWRGRGSTGTARTCAACPKLVNSAV